MSKSKKPQRVQRVSRIDSIKLDKTYFTEEGFLVDEPIVTSVGIFEYANPDGSIRRELRLPEHVFAEDSLKTYLGKPVIVTHDAGRVSARNVGKHHIGTILTEGYKDGDDVRAKIIIHDTIEMVESGLRELSLGYDLVLDETPGEWNGEPYDAVQTEIVINHLALVGEARAGEQARLNIDGTQKPLKGGKTTMAKKNPVKALSTKELRRRLDARRKHRLDEKEREDEEAMNAENGDEGLEDENTLPAEERDEGEEGEEGGDIEGRVKIIKDKRDRRDEDDLPETTEELLELVLQQDEDIDELVKIIEELQAKSDFEANDENDDENEANDDEDNEDEEDEDNEVKLVNKADGKGRKKTDISATIARAVAEQTKLLRYADRLNLDGMEGKSTKQIKIAIVKAVSPGMKLDGKGSSYINAAFDLAVETINKEKSTDRQRRQMSHHTDVRHDQDNPGSNALVARKRMNSRLMEGGDQ